MKFYPGSGAVEPLTFARIALILPHTSAIEKCCGLGLAGREPPLRIGLGAFSHSWGVLPLLIRIFQEELSSGISSLTFGGINRLLDGIGKPEALLQVGKIPEGPFKWKTGI